MALNTKQIDEYTAQAKEIWGETTAFKEFSVHGVRRGKSWR